MGVALFKLGTTVGLIVVAGTLGLLVGLLTVVFFFAGLMLGILYAAQHPNEIVKAFGADE